MTAVITRGPSSEIRSTLASPSAKDVTFSQKCHGTINGLCNLGDIYADPDPSNSEPGGHNAQKLTRPGAKQCDKI
ncbi:hypothetical protein AVEN_140389-1 [Araneus ventricosus]|uniref:Uncharacterized protein n=1 Tax=Araneus ventricosus TaxID=182803 RepID=A0A4Y2VLT9_ARAVE|nr:hypothetical protein AVEN_140389-1 [Araneus ventricosus]